MSVVLGGTAVGLIGVGATVIALAFTVHPVHVQAGVFWAVMASGATALLVGLFLAGRSLMSRSANGDDSPRERVGRDCRKVAEALDDLIDKRALRQPREHPFQNHDERMDRWRAETERRYRADLRPWVTSVFVEALAYTAVSKSARSLIDAPGADQLPLLSDVFREASARLESKPL